MYCSEIPKRYKKDLIRFNKRFSFIIISFVLMARKCLNIKIFLVENQHNQIIKLFRQIELILIFQNFTRFSIFCLTIECTYFKIFLLDSVGKIVNKCCMRSIVDGLCVD